MRKLTFFNLLLALVLNGIGAMAQETVRDYEKEALYHIETIEQMLDRQTEYPFDDLLVTEMSKLNDLKPMIEDERILRQIQHTMDAYYDKKNELMEKAAAQAQAQREAEQAQARAQARQDSINAAQAAQQLKEEQDARDKESKKQRIILIVIGIVLAIVLFVSNQLIQHFRNMKTQRSIMQMQQNATTPPKNMIQKRAEREVKRQVSKTTGQAERKGKEAIRKTVRKAGSKTLKGKKISI